MNNIELRNIDSEDIEVLLVKVEDSFEIEFAESELEYVNTFGEMCDHIKKKIQLDHVDNCTTQQAFYKLRKVISEALPIDRDQIRLDTLITEILPRRKRKKRVKMIEQNLGFKITILRPHKFVHGFLLVLLLTSFITLLYKWQFGLIGFGLAIGGSWIAAKTGNEVDIKNMGELTEKMTRENYFKFRRNSKSYNDNEIERVLVDLFSHELVIDKSKLTRDAKFNW
ncbi:MAG: hypothetical protein MI739_02120 [Bacteroidales bacterium]|nr:hypothetical protein [Bacteroidales bacterium]